MNIHHYFARRQHLDSYTDRFLKVVLALGKLLQLHEFVLKLPTDPAVDTIELLLFQGFIIAQSVLLTTFV